MCVSVSICKQKTCTGKRPSSLGSLTVNESENKIFLLSFSFFLLSHGLGFQNCARAIQKKASHVVYSILFQRHVNHRDADPPADGSLTGDYVTLAIVEAEVCLQLADALTGQAVHTEVPRVADALRLPRPPVHFALCILVARLEFTRVSLIP